MKSMYKSYRPLLFSVQIFQENNAHVHIHIDKVRKFFNCTYFYLQSTIYIEEFEEFLFAADLSLKYVWALFWLIFFLIPSLIKYSNCSLFFAHIFRSD